MAVVRLDPDRSDHVDAFRTIRLAALATDPDAFGATHAAALQYDAAAWRARVAGFRDGPGAVFVDDAADAAAPETTASGPAELHEPVRGVVGVGSVDPGDAQVWGMWVAPAGRGQGVARRLLLAAESWAADHGASTVTLFVNGSNDTARRVYERHGYRLLDPEHWPELVPSACSDEICMRISIAS